MNILNTTFLLRAAIAVTLLMHSIPTILDGSVNDFGKFYLNEEGFSPMGVPLAWAIKISHVLAAACLLLNRFIIPACAITLAIMIAGIIMVHGPEGWFVVGKGRNGVEFNFLVIVVLVYILYQDGLRKRLAKK